MHTPHLKFKLMDPDARPPLYATTGAAAFDLCALLHGGHVSIRPGEAANFRTGLAFEVPEGFVLLIFSRSGHGFNYGVRLSNCVGVIDSDYRGEVMVKLTSDVDRMGVFDGARIAQAMLVACPRPSMEEVKTLSETERGARGFGSTGTGAL